MKVFTSTDGCWSEKVNFVDENNVVLGYDMAQDCCEHADWFIADRPMNKIMERKTDKPRLNGYVFDKKFFKEVHDGDLGVPEYEFDEGGMAIFRITNGDKEKFIHIFNSHNGYYSHGFEFKAGQRIIQDRAL